jgi:hypothetical protein
MEAAKTLAESGHLVLIADLTNVVRAADLVVCDDPERPQLIECAPDMPQRFVERGRKGRQLRRAGAILEQLHYRRADHPDTHYPTVTVRVDTPTADTYGAVAEAVVQALEEGQAVITAEPGNVVWAIRDDVEPIPPPPEVEEMMAAVGDGIVGFPSALLDEPTFSVPPPIVWDVPPDLAFALMERDVRVIHLIDPRALAKVGTEDSHFVGIDRDSGSIDLLVDGAPISVAEHLLDDLLFGFQTIESTVQKMIEFVRRSRIQLPQEMQEPGGQSDEPIRFATRLEDAQRILSRQLGDEPASQDPATEPVDGPQN